jgi:drug/metabolite transporter (DMT)-like permease
MIIAGIAWGVYSVRGRKSAEPLTDTAFNFLRAISFAGVLLLLSLSKLHISFDGVVYAVISGAITSGIGYAIWYAALRDLALTAAAVVQLSVPVIAAVGGIVFVNENITLRLSMAALLILGGIFVTIIGRNIAQKQKKTKMG